MPFIPAKSGLPAPGRVVLVLVFVLPWALFPSSSGPVSARAAEQGDTIVLTAEDILASKALKMADVLNTVPGIKASESYVSIHGSYKVKVFLNGRPINDPTSSSGAVNWDLVSPGDVERIEILRGKGGLTHGRDAAGGVILVYTKNIRKLSGNIKAYGGGNETRNILGSVNGLSGKLTAGVSGGYETGQGYMANNDKERYKAGINLAYDPKQGEPVSFSMDYLADERGLSGLPEYPTPFSRKKTRNTAYSLHAQHLGVKSKTSYNEGYNHNTDTSRDLDTTLRVGKFQQNLTTTFDTLKNGEMDCGVEFTWDRANGSSFEDETENSGSVFASQSFSWPGMDLVLTAGLRAVYHSAFDHGVNPEVKLVYKKPAWRVTGAYSRTDNTPSFYQRYNETSSTRPNPQLDMETADNFSLALFVTPLDDFSLSLSLFHNLLTDRITYVTGDDGVGQYQNFGEVLYTGGDAAMSWQMLPGLKTKLSYTYLEVKDQDTDLWIPCKARHTTHVDVYWQPLPAVSAAAVSQYVSKVYRNKSNTRTVPEYMVSDIRVEYAFTAFTLFGQVKNVFDKSYLYSDGYLAPPRTWLAGVNWKF